MLVLSRKQNQEIVIGDNVKVTVLKVKGNTVRLGIEAPRDIRVIRGELPPTPQFREVEIELNDIAAEAEELASLQREAESMIASTEGHLDDAIADVTVVFENTYDSALTKRERFEGSGDVIPFSRAKATESKTRRLSPERIAQNVNSISFQGKLPEALKRNRLQEIVAQLTNK